MAYNDSRYVKIEGHTDLVKDKVTGAVLNVSKDVNKARKAKNIRQEKEREFDNLKNDVKEMKDMLEKVISAMKDTHGRPYHVLNI